MEEAHCTGQQVKVTYRCQEHCWSLMLLLIKRIKVSPSELVSLNECENHDLIWLSVQWAKRHFTMPHQEGIWKSAIRCCNLEQIRILAISVCYGTRSHAHTVEQPPLQKQLDEGENMQHSVTCYRRRRHAPVLGCNTWPF